MDAPVIRTSQRSFSRWPKLALKRVVLPLAIFGALAYFLPWVALVYAICGIYDVTRNSDLNLGTLQRYFTGNGLLTWVLSPINTLLDILCLPYVNKGIYRLEDLPPDYQEEVNRLIDTARKENLVGRLQERSKDFPRTMIFFKWYGVNVDTFLDIPAFRGEWKYVQTIGVSIFNKKVSTSKHFGFLRATLRLLYNLNDMTDRSAYLVVGDKAHYWKDEKLFIFDDTLMHQSFNETDQTRYCLFVDITRPSKLPAVMRAVVEVVRLLMRSGNYVFYKNWKVIER